MIALGYVLIAFWATVVLVSIVRLFFINKNAPDPKDPGRSTPTEVSASNVSQNELSTALPSSSSPTTDARP